MKEFIVTEKAKRPALPNDQCCFYCRQPIGSPHLAGEDRQCPMVQQKIIARVTFEYETWMPAGRTPEQYFSQRNEGSNCLDNDFDDAMEQIERLREAAGCLCGIVKVEHVRNVGEPYMDE